MTTAPAKNGTAQGNGKATTATPAVNNKPAEPAPAAEKPAETPTIEANKQLPPVITNPAAGNVPPIQKRLERFAELQRLHERRDQVTEALEDLEDFHIGTTGGASITLLDSRNTKKTINHPIVVTDMVNSAKQKLQVELEKIDSQFLV